jgi:hypothetical protein
VIGPRLAGLAASFCSCFPFRRRQAARSFQVRILPQPRLRRRVRLNQCRSRSPPGALAARVTPPLTVRNGSWLRENVFGRWRSPAGPISITPKHARFDVCCEPGINPAACCAVVNVPDAVSAAVLGSLPGSALRRQSILACSKRTYFEPCVPVSFGQCG